MWQPIDTIPVGRWGKSEPVLIYDPNKNKVCEALASKDGHYEDPVYSEWDEVGATHWMPLPDPPYATHPDTET